MSLDIKFQSDEHIPTAVIVGLRQRNIDILTTPEANLLGASDRSQLSFSTQENRVFVTQDNDLLALHAQDFQHCGIVFIQSRRTIGEMVRGLYLIHQILSADDMKDHVEFL